MDQSCTGPTTRDRLTSSYFSPCLMVKLINKGRVIQSEVRSTPYFARAVIGDCSLRPSPVQSESDDR